MRVCASGLPLPPLLSIQQITDSRFTDPYIYVFVQYVRGALKCNNAQTHKQVFIV